ncbi:hypothetical protein LSAT2_026845, partial [Lamellibrachia satsuma]
ITLGPRRRDVQLPLTINSRSFSRFLGRPTAVTCLSRGSVRRVVAAERIHHVEYENGEQQKYERTYKQRQRSSVTHECVHSMTTTTTTTMTTTTTTTITTPLTTTATTTQYVTSTTKKDNK